MKSAASRIVRFPAERVPRPASAGASGIDVARGRLRQGVCWLLNRLGVPGAVQNVELTDNVTGQKVAVTVGEFYVRLTVDGRDYYFDRITGRFDGTGTVF